MNERIKELWEDSDAIEVCYPEQGSPVSVSAKTLETFAELIIEDCICVVDGAVNHRLPASSYVDLIREHFAVE